MRPGGHRDDPVALLGEIVDPPARVRGRLRHARNHLEGTLDDAKLAPIAIDGEGFRRLGRRIERNEAPQSFRRAATCGLGKPLGWRRRSGPGPPRNSPTRQALARAARSNPGIATTSTTSSALRVKCAGLVGAQYVHGGGLVRGRKAGQQNSVTSQCLGTECGRERERCRQRHRDRGQQRRQGKADQVGRRQSDGVGIAR